MSEPVVNGASRRYDSPLRREQARLTERRILDSAGALFVDLGYAGTTMARIAVDAGVAAQTVYKAFASKAALAKRLYDVTLAGDDDDVPLGDRPEFTTVRSDPDPRRALAAYARVGRLVAERLNPLYGVLLAGAQAGDEDLRALVEVTERERMTGTGFMARRLAELDGLRPGLPVRRANEILWALTGPELQRRFVGECGWSYDEYETWLADTMAASVLR